MSALTSSLHLMVSVFTPLCSTDFSNFSCGSVREPEASVLPEGDVIVYDVLCLVFRVNMPVARSYTSVVAASTLMYGTTVMEKPWVIEAPDSLSSTVTSTLMGESALLSVRVVRTTPSAYVNGTSRYLPWRLSHVPCTDTVCDAVGASPFTSSAAIIEPAGRFSSILVSLRVSERRGESGAPMPITATCPAS